MSVFLYFYYFFLYCFFFFFQAEDGIRDGHVTGVQTCALPISFYLRDEAPDVRVVESGLDLVQQVEGARSREEEREQERDRPERLLSAGEQRSEERRVGKECRSRWSTDH